MISNRHSGDSYIVERTLFISVLGHFFATFTQIHTVYNSDTICTNVCYACIVQLSKVLLKNPEDHRGLAPFLDTNLNVWLRYGRIIFRIQSAGVGGQCVFDLVIKMCHHGYTLYGAA